MASTTFIIARGVWNEENSQVRMSQQPTQEQQQQHQLYEVGQIVNVHPRTWAGINRPGGIGRITQINYGNSQNNIVESVNVKYLVNGGSDTNVGLSLIQPQCDLQPRNRQRRTQNSTTILPSEQNNSENRRPVNKNKTNANKKRRPSQKKNKSNKATATTKNKKPRRVVNNKAASKPRPTATTAVKKPVTPSNSIIDHNDDDDDIPREISIVVSDQNASRPNQEISPFGSPITTMRRAAISSKHHTNTTTNDTECCAQQRYTQSPATTTNNSSNDNESFFSSSDDDDDNERQRIMYKRVSSPLEKQHKASSSKTNVFATNMAVGSFDDDDDGNHEDRKPEASDSNNNKVILRAVFDTEKKKATRFIGQVVAGVAKPLEEPKPTAAELEEQQHLNRFREILNELLLDNDGMLDVENVAEQVRNAARNELLFTDEQVKIYIDRLCAEDKIMQTDGVIVNI